MIKRIFALGLALWMLGAPLMARAAGAGNAALYTKYQRMFESVLERQGRGGAPQGGKREVYVDGRSTEGGTLAKYMDERGIASRYRLTLFGEMGRVQSDYYPMDGALCLTVLETHYSDFVYLPGSDELFTDFAKYVLDGDDWYRLDDAGGLAYRVETPNVHALDELEQMLEEGQPIPENGGGYDGWEGNPNDMELDIPHFRYDALRAALNQPMATRTGPSTRHTEAGTFPRDTDIRVFYQIEGNGAMWGLVEFLSGGEKYRLYTGMRRIDAEGVPTGNSDDYVSTWLNQAVTPLYGPGGDYAAQPDALPMGETVKVYFQENGYAMVDCEGENQVVRGWVPLSALELTIGC